MFYVWRLGEDIFPLLFFRIYLQIINIMLYLNSNISVTEVESMENQKKDRMVMTIDKELKDIVVSESKKKGIKPSNFISILVAEYAAKNNLIK